MFFTIWDCPEAYRILGSDFFRTLMSDELWQLTSCSCRNWTYWKILKNFPVRRYTSATQNWTNNRGRIGEWIWAYWYPRILRRVKETERQILSQLASSLVIPRDGLTLVHVPDFSDRPIRLGAHLPAAEYHPVSRMDSHGVSLEPDPHSTGVSPSSCPERSLRKLFELFAAVSFWYSGRG